MNLENIKYLHLVMTTNNKIIKQKTGKLQETQSFGEWTSYVSYEDVLIY